MHRHSNETPRSFGQAMVEFLLIVPLIVVLVLGIVEAVRIAHSFLGIENAARFGVRYAVTGEWGSEECETLFGGDCTNSEQEQEARIATVAKVAMQGSSSIYIDELASIDEPGYFQVITCSAPGIVVAPSSPSDFHQCVNENGDPFEYAGDPGEYVVVVIDYNYPITTPFFTQIWSHLHLSSTRLARVENYRTGQAGPPPPIITRTATAESTATLDQTTEVTPSPTLTPSQTPSPTPTDGPDCDAFIVSDVGVDGNTFQFTIQNTGSVDAYFQHHLLEWPVDGSSGFDAFYMGPYDPNRYYDPVSPIYNSPISVPVDPERYLHNWMGSQTIKSIFHQIPQGAFHTTLTIGFWSTEQKCYVDVDYDPPTPTPSPTPDCSWMIVGPLTYDEGLHRFEMSVGNGSLQSRQLTGTTIEWTKEWESQYLDWIAWKGTNYYEGDDEYSPTIADPDPTITIPLLDSGTWAADFYVDDPPGPLLDYTADYIVTLTFADGCQVVKEHHKSHPTPTPGPTPNCADLLVTDVRVSGDDFEVQVSNQTQAELTFWDATIEWPDTMGMNINTFTFKSLIPYDFTNYFNSPTTSEIADSILTINSTGWLEVDFDNTPIEGLWGSFNGNLRFLDPAHGFYCTVSAEHTEPQPPTPTPSNTPTITPTPSLTPTPTDTPPPSCSNFAVSNVGFGSNDFQFDIQNLNVADAYLRNTTLIWPVDGSSGFDNFHIGPYASTTYYNPFFPVYTSPISVTVNPEIRLSDWYGAQTWEANFHQLPEGAYQATLTYGFWYTSLECDIVVNGNYIAPTPTNTQPPTNTPPPTHTPLPTNTPSTDPDCSKLVVNNVVINGDKFDFYVRNDNPMPAYLTYSTLYWPANEYAPPQVYNKKLFNSVRYHGVDSYFSPVNASAPSMLLAAGTNRLWSADFNSVTQLQGTYQALLTFEFPGWGTCQVSALKTGGVENTATPTNTPPPASTYTPTPTHTSSPLPTNTSTPTPISTSGAPTD